MIDYNLYGMSYISARKVNHRKNSLKTETNYSGDQNITLNLNKLSCCEQEIDILAEDILIHVNAERSDNPGLAFIWDDEKTRRQLNSIDMTITPESISLRNDNNLIRNDDFMNIIEQNLLDTSRSSSINNITYPIETNENENILESSIIEYHHSDNETRNKINSSNSSSIDFFNILQDLEHEVQDEKDSILTQIINEEGDSDNDEFDMSLPFETTITPEEMKDILFDETIKNESLGDDTTYEQVNKF